MQLKNTNHHLLPVISSPCFGNRLAWQVLTNDPNLRKSKKALQVISLNVIIRIDQGMHYQTQINIQLRMQLKMLTAKELALMKLSLRVSKNRGEKKIQIFVTEEPATFFQSSVLLVGNQCSVFQSQEAVKRPIYVFSYRQRAVPTE